MPEDNSIILIESPLTPDQDKSVAKTSWVTSPYVKAATSQNTRLAYSSDIRQYEAWGGRLPASPELIAHYLESQAPILNARTLARHLVSLKNWHTYQGFPDPTAHPVISKTLTGISRIHGKPKDKAPPLTPEDLLRIANYLYANDSLVAVRDNAILQVGFFGALRRSELVSISYEQIQWQTDGIEILLPTSKTDPLHTGQYCAIPYGRGKLCAVKALEKWLKQANITQGPVFRRLIRGEQLGNHALTPLNINLILKQRAQQAGLNEPEFYSSHSLRRGFATSAAKAGATLPTIMRHGRWKQVSTVMEYIEASERFSDNAATSVLEKMDIPEKEEN